MTDNRLAELQGAATVREFHKTMFRQMGMRMVTLIAWEDPEDSLFVCEYPVLTGLS